MKRESSSEPTNQPASVEKRPRVEVTGVENLSRELDVSETLSGLTSNVKDSEAVAEASTSPVGATASEDTSTPADNQIVSEKPSKGKGKFRGRGRGRGRDQRAQTDRNAEKAGGKRVWEGSRPRRGTREDGAPEESEGVERGPRLPKRKVAMQIGFCGTGYNGMQIQRDAHTIENTLFDAMVKAGAVSKDNSDDPVKVNLQRAARTDAGVHAAGNVVSLKMITEPPDMPDLVARLNELLPPEIRVWKFVRALNAFNSRTYVPSNRVYEYLLPSYALLPPKPDTPMAQHTKPTLAQEPGSGPDWDYWDRPDADNLEIMRGWRVSKAQLAALRENAKIYEGIGLRYMLNIDVKDPQVFDDIEWISIMFHGQSFMLHQIVRPQTLRKMTTLLVFASRTGTPASVLIPKVFEAPKLTIPKAPSLGLLLQEPRFGMYNKHVTEENEQAISRNQTDRVRELIEWEPLKEGIDEFKREFIYARLREEETKHGVFAAWLRFIDEYEGPEFNYLNPQAEVPPEAIVKRGQRKRGATDKFREYLWKNPAGKEAAGVESSDDEEGKKPDAETEG
ncbi:tRNA pseudouridine synthase 1 [Ceratobasidium sp. 392]|nr:tRNA pseudouridine synthase 1 [Ceratobasidium sp. 392]